MTDAKSFLSEFLRRLERLRDQDDRAALAALRRGLGQRPWTVSEVSKVIEYYFPQGLEDHLAQVCYIVAPLFAEHSQAGGEGNLGDHFRAMCEPVKPDEPMPRNTERRFMLVLSSDFEELPDTLRQAGRLLKSKDVPVNWQQLLWDVYRWSHPDRKVQKAWSQAFWRPKTPNPNSQSQPTETQP